jgi:hypothetical protein
MNSIPNVNIPNGQIGDFKVIRKHVEPRFQFSMDGRYVPNGEYTFLYYKDTLLMSDTPDEKRDHYSAVYQATGNCLIAGLGIGMVLNAMCLKPEVKHITIIEISQEVIDLVGKHYLEMYPNKIEIICADIYTWKPLKETIYDLIWFDVWNHLCTDNLEQMSMLHRRFARKAKWKGSWGKEYLQYQKRREKCYY